MKRTRALTALAFGVLLVGGCGVTRSLLTLAPGEQFVLGGPGDGGFHVQAHNRGPGAVVLITHAGKQASAPDTLGSGQRESVRVDRGWALVLRNSSEQTARVAVEIRSARSVTMRTVDPDVPWRR